ncbi:MAG: hypothetical protein ACE5H1_01190 [Thermodesulfobacteriota bacterium]
MSKVKGKVEAVSVSRGGIKIGEDWYNAKDAKVKAYVTADLKGHEVEITISDEAKRQFDFIVKHESPTSATPSPETPAAKTTSGTKDPSGLLSQGDYWQRREQRDLRNDVRISRHGALNTAIELLKLKIQSGGKIDPGKGTLETVESFADLILIYVNKKGDRHT